MLVARNIAHVQTQKRNSRIRTVAGLVFFVGGSVLLALSTLEFLILAYGLVLAGFFFFNTGLQGITKWSRKIRNDQLIDDRLRRLSDRYTLIHYPAIGNRHPEHILIHETGVIVMTSKDVYGGVAVEGNRYRKVGGGALTRFIGGGGPQLGQPAAENALDRKAVLESLAAQAAERGWPTDFPIDGLVVFVANRLVLTGGETGDPPAVKLAELLPWVQAHTRGMPIVLPGDIRQQIADFLIASGGAAEEGRIDPRGATVADESADKRAARRPATVAQVAKERGERERQARSRPVTPVAEDAAAPATATSTLRRFSRRRAEPDAEAEAESRPAKPAAPLVPSSGMVKAQRRARSKR